MRQRLRRWIPSEDTLNANPSLRWLGPLLRRPWLWQLTRRRVAAGAAIGVFFGFVIPVMQIAGAAVASVALRANLPVAAVATLVSNPFTYVPIWIAAYQTGTVLLGDPVDAEQARASAQALATPLAGGTDGTVPAPTRWAERVLDIGKPLFVGLFVFGVVGAAVTWVGVHLLWRLGLALRRRRRRNARLNAG